MIYPHDQQLNNDRMSLKGGEDKFPGDKLFLENEQNSTNPGPFWIIWMVTLLSKAYS